MRALIEGEAHEEKDEEDDDYKDDDEINELIARGDSDLQIFREIDAKSKRKGLMEAHELPSMFIGVLEEEQRQAKGGMQREDAAPSIRSSQLKQVAYDETISDDAWLRRLEKGTRQQTRTPALKLRLSAPSTTKSIDTTTTTEQVSEGAGSNFTPDSRVKPHHYAHVLNVIESLTDKQSGRYRAELFAELPSSVDYPDYYDLITSPISLAEIHSKAYSCLEELLADISLMTANAMKYNLEGSLVYEDAMQIRLAAEKAIGNIKRKLDNDEDVDAVEDLSENEGEEMDANYDEGDDFVEEDEMSDE